MIRYKAEKTAPLLCHQQRFIEVSVMKDVNLVAPGVLLGTGEVFFFVDQHMENELPRYGVHSSEGGGYFVDNRGNQVVNINSAIYLGSALDFLYYESIVYTLAKFFAFIEQTDRNFAGTVILNKNMSIKVRDWLVSRIQIHFPNSNTILLHDGNSLRIEKLQIFSLKTELLNTNLTTLQKQIKSLVPQTPGSRGRETRILLMRNKNVFYSMKSRKPRNSRIFERYAQVRGYLLIDPGRLDFEEVLKRMSSANNVVSYHGGALVNILACNPGTRICEVYSEWYADCFEKIADCCGLEYVQYFYKMKKRPDLLRLAYYMLTKLDKKAYVKHFRIRIRDFNKILGLDK